MKSFLTTKIIICFAALGLAFFAYAETTVVNTVSSSANSGGNTAGQGKVVESSSEATVNIKTTINGVTVQEIHKTVEGDTPLEINEVRTYANADGTASVKTNASVKVNATTSATSLSSTEQEKAELKGNASTTAVENEQSTSTPKQAKRSTYLSRLKQFFLNVFARFTFK